MAAEPLDLNEIRRVAEAASPPPWEAEDGTSETDVPVRAGADYLCWSPDDGVRGGHSRADAEFIARARKWVPALATEVENLRADRAQWAWKAGAARGTAHEIVALLPVGKLRDQAAAKVADLDRALFPSAAAGEQREADGA